MKASKNTVVTVAMTMAAVLICVGFGFHLGTKQVAYSQSKYSDESEYGYLQEYPDLGPVHFVDIEDEAPQEPFVTAGELIEETDNYAWLLPAAASLASDGTAVKATLSTNIEWKNATSYRAMLNLPDNVFVDGSHCKVNVYYPVKLKAGETGNIVIIAAADNGYVYCGFCQFEAADNLRIVYGSSIPEVASGGEFDSYANRLAVNFYTAATSEHYSHRDGSAGKFGADGNISMVFNDINNPATMLDVPAFDE